MAEAFKNWLFIDQLKIMGYGESDSSGCWMKFQLTPELLEVVRGRKGEMVEVAARLIDNAGEHVPPGPNKPPATYDEVVIEKPLKNEVVVTKGEHGKYWQGVIAHGTFNAPPVLEAIGTDEDFLHWIRKQPSCLSGAHDWDELNGEGRNEPAHVRRISEGAGEGTKPDYYCVPMTHAEHFLQHQSGETACLNLHGPKKRGADPGSYNEAEAFEWFEKKAQHYRTEWASQTLAETLGFERRSKCPPKNVEAWTQLWDLCKYFPKTFEK